MNKWSETGYYENKTEPKSNPGSFERRGFKPNAKTPSPTLSWHLAESEKRRKGEYNELDMAEIRAVIQGYKNDWWGIVKANLEFFERFVQIRTPGGAQKLWGQAYGYKTNKNPATASQLTQD